MRNFLIARLSASLSYVERIQSGILKHNGFLIFNSSIASLSSSALESESESNNHQQYSFTASHLIKSYGLSPKAAVELSKRQKFRLKNTDTPNVVFDLLMGYGFSQTQLSLLAKRQPMVLLANAETDLLPKLRFLHSIGVSNSDLPKILINRTFLLRSLENNIIPRYEILKSVLLNEKQVVKTLKRNPSSFLHYDAVNDLVPNVKVLRQHGVPQSSISLLITSYPDVAYMKHAKFAEAAKRAKEMGCNPLQTVFVQAVEVLVKVDKAKWESKLELYKRWGWSTDDTLTAFKKFPHCMCISEKRITKLMNFLLRDMGWSLEDFAKYPVTVSYSLEKRIIPRCSVIKILQTKGLVSVDLSLSFIPCTEQKFLKRFVTKFTKDIPLLLNVYKGQLDLGDVLQS